MTHIFDWLGWHNEEINKQEIWDCSFAGKTYGEARIYFERGPLSDLFKVQGIRRNDCPILQCYPGTDFLLEENHMVVLIPLYFESNDGSWDYRHEGDSGKWW